MESYLAGVQTVRSARQPREADENRFIPCIEMKELLRAKSYVSITGHIIQIPRMMLNCCFVERTSAMESEHDLANV